MVAKNGLPSLFAWKSADHNASLLSEEPKFLVQDRQFEDAEDRISLLYAIWETFGSLHTCLLVEYANWVHLGALYLHHVPTY